VFRNGPHQGALDKKWPGAGPPLRPASGRWYCPRPTYAPLPAMTRTLSTTPHRDGYRMPGEFEPHAGCWMLWPERPDNWRLGGKPAQQAFVAVATAIAASDPVSVGVSTGQYSNARRLLPSQIRVIEMSSNDAWMRDVGPTFVVNGRGGMRGVDWVFNAWGGSYNGLYSPWDLDDAVPSRVAELERFHIYHAPLVLEGAWAAAPDKAAPGVNEPADFAHDFGVGPPASAAPGGFGVAVVDNDVHVAGNAVFLDFRKAEKLDLHRQASEAFQQVCAGDLNDIGTLD